MKELSAPTRMYIFTTLGAGSVIMISQLGQIRWDQLGLLVLSFLAAMAQTYKVNGPTDRSNYNIAWLLYGFTFVALGVQATLFVILVAHLAEWARHRYPWYIQTFNIAVYALAALAAEGIYRALNPTDPPIAWQGALGLLAALVVFTLLNHLLVGLVIRLARGQSLAELGVFEFLTLVTDFTLIGLGAASALVFLINPFGAILNIIPVYLLYQALKVPALGRRIRNLEARLASLETVNPGLQN